VLYGSEIFGSDVLFRHLCGSCARQEWPGGIDVPWPVEDRMMTLNRELLRILWWLAIFTCYLRSRYFSDCGCVDSYTGEHMYGLVHGVVVSRVQVEPWLINEYIR